MFCARMCSKISAKKQLHDHGIHGYWLAFLLVTFLLDSTGLSYVLVYDWKQTVFNVEDV